MNAVETNVYRPVIGDYSCPCPINLSPVDWRQGMLIRSANWLGDAVMSLPGVYRLHNLAIDSRGNLYTTEVNVGQRVQKFDRVE